MVDHAEVGDFVFVSYAQNFEDVILWRALKHVDTGVYVDIGANHPVIDSVSKAFSDRGWRGVHVEPLPDMARQLREQRPGDTVIEAMVGTADGSKDFFDINGTGVSTSIRDIATGYAAGGAELRVLTVSVVSLDAILAGFQPSAPIHWLKIDVEGAEADALRSWGASPQRPWVVVVESTAPLSQIPTHREWEHELDSRGYEFVYFDGVNRFYLHESQAGLRHYFGPGPNTFDDFTVWVSSPYCRAARDETERLVQRQLDLFNDCSAKVVALESELELMRTSRAWRFAVAVRRLRELWSRHEPK